MYTIKENHTINKLTTLNINMHCGQCISIKQEIIEIALLNSVFKCNHSVTTNTTNRKRIPWVDNSTSKKIFTYIYCIVFHRAKNSLR